MTDNPIQGELELGGEGRPGPYLSDAPWQYEAMWRTILNTCVLFVAAACGWIVDVLIPRLFGEPSGTFEVLVLTFNATVVPAAAVAVVSDFGQLLARRAPRLWAFMTQAIRSRLPRPRS